MLHNTVVLGGRLHHFAAFPDVVGARFLHVHVFAGLAGHNGSKGMPVVGGGNADGVYFLVVEHLAQILLRLYFFPVLFLKLARPFLQDHIVRVAQGHHLHVRQLHVVLNVVLAAAV